MTRVRLVKLYRIICLSQKTCLLHLMNFKTFNSLDGVIDTTLKIQRLRQVCLNFLNLTSNTSFINFALQSVGVAKLRRFPRGPWKIANSWKLILVEYISNQIQVSFEHQMWNFRIFDIQNRNANMTLPKVAIMKIINRSEAFTQMQTEIIIFNMVIFNNAGLLSNVRLICWPTGEELDTLILKNAAITFYFMVLIIMNIEFYLEILEVRLNGRPYSTTK